MKARQQIICPYCQAQGVNMIASQTGKAIMEMNTRYSCGNEHYFAVPTATVPQPERK